MRVRINQLVRELGSKRKEIDTLTWMMRESNLEIEKKEKKLEGVKDLESMKKQHEGQVKKLESKEKQYEGQVKELASKEKQFKERSNELSSKEKQLNKRSNELSSKEKQLNKRSNELSSKEKQLNERLNELSSKEKQYGDQVKELKSKERQFEEQVKDIEGQVKELESKEKQFQVQVNELELIQKHFEGQVKEFDSKEKQFQGQVKELESKEKQFQGQVKEFDSKEKQFQGQVKELESKQKHFEGQVKELESKEKLFVGQMKDLESKKNQFEGQVKELDLKEAQFIVKLKELESKERQFEGQLRELDLKEKQYESLRKSFEEEKVLIKKSNILLHQVETEQLYFKDADSVSNSKDLQLLFNLLKKYELLCSQVSDVLHTSADPAKLVLDTIKGFHSPQLRQELIEYDANILRRICSSFLMDELKKSSPVTSLHVKQEAMKLASDWKVNIAAGDKDCLGVLDFLKFVATYEIGSSFNENELQNLLDIIAHHCQTPQALGCIEKLQEQLMRMSPRIEPHVREEAVKLALDLREEAMKLALDLKANMRANTENSLVVLGFLLLLSVYGLVSYFNEDEVLKLFEFAAQHKQAVSLFRTLGFVDKISDFVQNLVQNQQHIEAVRFICAYKLAYKIQPVDLLRQHMLKAKLISKRIC
ncbi:uncharacterized protein LOC133292548, partial [Gastrolobium bilobum]|uniref:uncharacterized protein LOC133292548 n=1 Tax=Gastrolobium bilobum TaxID=150636 RepID=UPI002AB24219